MFNKKFSLVLITLVFMLSLSAVAAVDANSTDDIIAGEVDEEPPSGNVTNISDSEVVLTANPNDNYVLSSVDNGKYYSGGSYDFILSNNDNPVENVSVSISLNGVVFTQNTDDAGKVSVPLDLKAGTYKISASYDNVSANDTVKVLSVVTGKDITKTYKSTTKYTATFLDGNGAPLKNTKVKFKINGKTYTQTSDTQHVSGYYPWQ